MNRRNDWKHLLELANFQLAKYGFTIEITDYEGDGYYTCVIKKCDGWEEVYAENFYEDELSDLVTEVWHYVLTEKIGK
jgi:hypothetical protein